MYRHWVKLRRPKEVETEKQTTDGRVGVFSCAPLERGYGTTIGNAFCRVLLSSIRGAAITTVKVDGALHEFAAIPGVTEDVADIILNLKGVRLRVPEGERRELRIDVVGPAVVTAKDIQGDPLVDILNPDHHVATVAEGGRLKIDLTAEQGRGYVPADKHRFSELPIGTIVVDSLFSPMKRVNFRVTNARAGEDTDLDKLTMEIETDGSIIPREALGLAAKILKEQLQIFIGFDEGMPAEYEGGKESTDSLSPNLYRSVEELELSVRSGNCLRNANIRFIGELVQKSESDMLKTKNFGRKSLKEIKEVLASMGLTLGMKVDGFDTSRTPKGPKE